MTTLSSKNFDLSILSCRRCYQQLSSTVTVLFAADADSKKMELSKFFTLCVRVPLLVLLVGIAAEFFASSKTVTGRIQSYTNLRPMELPSRNIEASVHSPAISAGHATHHEVMKEPSFRLVAPPSHDETALEYSSSLHHQSQDVKPDHVSEHGNHIASHYDGHNEGHHAQNHHDNHYGSYHGNMGQHEEVHLYLENHPGGHHGSPHHVGHHEIPHQGSHHESDHHGGHHESPHHKGHHHESPHHKGHHHESHHHKGWGWHGGHKEEGDTLDKFWNLLGPILFPLGLFVTSLPFALPVIPFAIFTQLNATDDTAEGR